MPKLRGKTVKVHYFLKVEVIDDISAMADNMEVYQSDLVTDAFNLYSNLRIRWEDEFSNTEKAERQSFEDWLEELF